MTKTNSSVANTTDFKRTPIFDKLVMQYDRRNEPIYMPLVRKNIQLENQSECKHFRIEQDEPRDGGGAWYRCYNKHCHMIVDPDDWENEHDKAWDWWMK